MTTTLSQSFITIRGTAIPTEFLTAETMFDWTQNRGPPPPDLKMQVMKKHLRRVATFLKILPHYERDVSHSAPSLPNTKLRDSLTDNRLAFIICIHSYGRSTMKKHIFLLLFVFLLFSITGCTVAPTPTPTPVPPTNTPRPTSTSSPTAIATKIPTETPIPTGTPIPTQLAEQLDVTFEMIFFIQVNAELVAEAASRVGAGELKSEEAFSILLVDTSLAKQLDRVIQGISIPDQLVEPWGEALEVHSNVKEILDRWFNGAITPEDVIAELESHRQSAGHATEAAQEVFATLLGLDAAEMTTAREDAIAAVIQQFLEPTPTAQGCSEQVEGAPAVSVSGQIAFVSTRDGNPEIYVTNIDGSGLIRLTNDPAGDFAPAWSPDGSRIAFYSERDGNAEIYVMNADGTGLTRLTDNPANDYNPSWSPDGTNIAFHSHRYLGAGRIFVMNTDGTGAYRLTDPSFDDWSPEWSPDGKKIVFNSSRGASLDIWVMNANGSGKRNLNNDTADDWWPSWSPDGTHVVFHSDRDGNFEIYVMTADGMEVTRLTDNPANDYDADWSPDGTRIAFTSDRSGNLEVCVINVDGTGIWNVTNHPAADWSAAWRP
jgi:Tol biopolymer transport system component